MEEAGAKLVKHYRDLAFMGFLEVVKHLGTILKNIDFCKKDVTNWKPDVLVLIDYPGFNLRIAKWAHQQHLKVLYYISPQVWAWKEGRVKDIRQYVDKMLVILPFEKQFYADRDYQVEYVGHPLLQVIAAELKDAPVPLYTEKPIIALLPGSRAQEIRQKLPLMLKMADRFQDYKFVIAGAPAQPDSIYKDLIGDAPVMLLRNDTYNLLKQAKAALVTSGTATLETALFGVPQVVCYRGNPISFWLARKLVKVPFISLVNLIMGKEVVKELVQTDFNETSLANELNMLIMNEVYRENMISAYHELWEKLGQGNASELAATETIALANGRAAVQDAGI